MSFRGPRGAKFFPGAHYIEDITNEVERIFLVRREDIILDSIKTRHWKHRAGYMYYLAAELLSICINREVDGSIGTTWSK